MNIADYDLTAAAERGILVPLIHPATGMRMVDENKVELAFRIAGMDSERWRAAVKKRKAADVESGVPAEVVENMLANISDKSLNDTIKAVIADSVIELVGSWEWDKEPLEPKFEHMIKIFMAPGFNW